MERIPSGQAEISVLKMACLVVGTRNAARSLVQHRDRIVRL